MKNETKLHGKHSILGYTREELEESDEKYVRKEKKEHPIRNTLLVGLACLGFGLYAGHMNKKDLEKRLEEQAKHYETKVADTVKFYKQKWIDPKDVQDVTRGYMEFYDQVAMANSFFAKVEGEQKNYAIFLDELKDYVKEEKTETKDEKVIAELDKMDKYVASHKEKSKEVLDLIRNATQMGLYIRYNKAQREKDTQTELLREANTRFIKTCGNIQEYYQDGVNELTSIMSHISTNSKEKAPRFVHRIAKHIVTKEDMISEGIMIKATYEANNKVDWIVPVDYPMRTLTMSVEKGED